MASNPMTHAHSQACQPACKRTRCPRRSSHRTWPLSSGFLVVEPSKIIFLI